MLVALALCVSCIEVEGGDGSSGGSGSGAGGQAQRPSVETVTPERAQALADTAQVPGTKVDGAPPTPTADPNTPSVANSDDGTYGTPSGNLELRLGAEVRPGTTLAGVYLQTVGADFYWDIPVENTKQSGDYQELDVELSLPDAEPGIEVCFDACVYTSDDLVSQPVRICAVFPEPSSDDQAAVGDVCSAVAGCGFIPEAECNDYLLGEVAAQRYDTPECDAELDAVVSCVAALTVCQDLAVVFGDEDGGAGDSGDGGGEGPAQDGACAAELQALDTCTGEDDDDDGTSQGEQPGEQPGGDDGGAPDGDAGAGEDPGAGDTGGDGADGGADDLPPADDGDAGAGA